MKSYCDIVGIFVEIVVHVIFVFIDVSTEIIIKLVVLILFSITVVVNKVVAVSLVVNVANDILKESMVVLKIEMVVTTV